MTDPKHTDPQDAKPTPAAEAAQVQAEQPKRPRLEPTRYGDWELNGKCVDF